MSLPPDEVPCGLDSKQYQLIGLQYMLMGLSAQASESMSRSREIEPGYRQADEEMKFGANMISALFELVNKLEDLDQEANEAAEAFSHFQAELVAMDVLPHETREFVDKILESMNDIDATGPPPREVPEGLTAEEYYQLGISYKQLGWTEQARDALLASHNQDPRGKTGKFAFRFLQTKLPRQPVPLFAEQRNIEGYNLMVKGDLIGAREIFARLNEDYPEFEWPWGNLASICIQARELKAARLAVEKALAINPSYINAWLHNARIEALLEDFESSYCCLNEAFELSPEDSSIARIAQLIHQLEELSS